MRPLFTLLFLRLTTLVFFGIALVVSLRAETHAIATTVTPVSIKIPYGETRIPAGARLEVVSSDSAIVRVRYLGDVYTLSIQSVTISPAVPEVEKAKPSEVAAQPAARAVTPAAAGKREPITSRKLEAATYVAKTDRGQGSAFVVRMAEKNYLVTNYHVLGGAQTAQFVGSAGTIALEPSSPVEVAIDRDLVRIDVTST